MAILYLDIEAYVILLILLAYLSNSLAIYCEYSLLHFTVEPSDKTAKEGSNASFNCTTKIFNTQNDTLSWDIFPNNYMYERKDVFDSQRAEMTSIITVKNIGKTNQYFSCNLKNQQQRCFASRKAVLSVQYFPDQDDLTCNPQHLIAIKEGKTQEILCEVPRGEPAVDLSWSFSPPGKSDPLLPTLQDDGTYRVLSHRLLVTQQLHLKEIACTVTSDLVFPGQRHQCSIGPITVLYPPHVFVQPRQTSISYARPADLSCMADGYPEQFNFSWSCFPEGILRGCEGNGQKAKLYLHETSDIDVEYTKHISVTCTVTNPEGKGVGSSYITITREVIDDMQEGNTELDSLSCQDTVSLNVTMHANRSESNDSLTFVCEALGSTERCEIHNIVWYLGNSILSGNKSSVIEQKLISEISLTIASVCDTNDTQTLTCKVSASNYTVQTSFDLTKSSEHLMSLCSQNSENESLLNKTFQKSNKAEIFPVIHHETDELLEKKMNGTWSIKSTVNADIQKTSVLKIWQIVTITVAGAVVTVILTACIVIILSMYMYKYITHQPNTQNKCSESTTECKDRYSIGSIVEPIYDEPWMSSCKLGRCKSLPDIARDNRFSSTHIYDSSVYHASYISSSSGSSWSYSTDPREDRGDGTQGSSSSDQGLSCMAEYKNAGGGQVDRRHTLGHVGSL